MNINPRMIILLLAVLLLPSAGSAAQTADELVHRAHDYLRGRTSVSVVEMVIHRPSWERGMTIKAWTRGEEDSIFKIIAPAKDKDNGTLKMGQEMWTYNPKVNRVIKIPPSMMSQAWMGSDFSNNDLAKSDTILTDYTHSIVGREEHEGKTVYVIESLPKPQAPVVWGKQVLKLREDDIYLSQEFFDEDMVSVKILESMEIGELGGRIYPTVWRMRKTDSTDEYTLLRYTELTFDVELEQNLFTVEALKRPLR